MDPVNNAGPVIPATSGVDVNQNVNVQPGMAPVQPNSGQQPQSQPDFSQRPAALPPDGSQVPAGQPVLTPDELARASDRLRTQNARMAKVLSAVGIDPASDIGEQLEGGLLTPDMVRNHVVSKWAPQNTQVAPGAVQPMQTVQDPVAVAQAEYEAAQAKYDAEAATGEININTNTALLKSIQKLNKAELGAVSSQISAGKPSQADENLQQVLSVARAVPEYEAMGADLKNSLEIATIGVTGIIADTEARKMGLDPARLTPGQYAYFARSAQSKLGPLVEYFKEAGRREVRQGFVPRVPNNNTFVPVPAGGGQGSGVVPVNPYSGVNVNNHRDAARDYAGNVQPRV